MATFDHITVSVVRAASGVPSHVWSGTDWVGNDSGEAVRTAIREGAVTKPGLYVVCWNVADLVPFARLYTVYKDEHNVLRHMGGIHVHERITRWPPRVLIGA